MKRNKFFNNIYLTNIDYLVIITGVFFLCLIVFIELLFADYLVVHKLESIKNIAYSIFTSVIASTIFYLFNILIPKIKEIKNLIEYLKPLLENVNFFSLLIIEKFVSEEYDIKDISDFSNYTNSNSIKSENDFIEVFKVESNFKMAHNLLVMQKKMYDSLLLNYSAVILKKISVELNDLNYSLGVLDSMLLTKEILMNSDTTKDKLDKFSIEIVKNTYYNLLIVMRLSIALNKGYKKI